MISRNISESELVQFIEQCFQVQAENWRRTWGGEVPNFIWLTCKEEATAMKYKGMLDVSGRYESLVFPPYDRDGKVIESGYSLSVMRKADNSSKVPPQ